MMLLAGVSIVQGEAPHQIPEITSPISIDGILDEIAWDQAWSAELDWEVWPEENVQAPVRTVVLLAYNDSAIFVGFRAYDPEPDKIRAHLSDRDTITDDDWVGVVLDTFNDERRSFNFRVNPRGVQEDNVVSQLGGGASWDAIWDSAGRVTEWGYAVEMKIPFSSLRFQRSTTSQVWGLDAERSYPRSVVHEIGLFPRDRNNNCYLCQADKVEGFAGAMPGHNLEIVPTITGTRTDSRDQLPAGELEQGKVDTEAGVTGYWGITPNMTLTTTINPDFSQVEADARKLDINEPFALSYEEKRPFFLEGADFFSTPFSIVYTRTLRDPVWGIKLTGKEGGHTVGSYIVKDSVTNLVFPGSQSSSSAALDQESTAFVFRYKLDFGDQVTFGAIYTGRESGSYYNRVFGIDADIRVTDKDRVWINLLGSGTGYSDDMVAEYGAPSETLHDFTLSLFYIHSSRNFGMWGEFLEVGEGFRADLGFVPRVGFRQVRYGSEWEWVPDADSWFTQLEIEGEIWQIEDELGRLLKREYNTAFTYQGALQSYAYLAAKKVTETYNGLEFDLNDLQLYSSINPNGNSYLWFNMAYGDQIDYVNTQLGERLRLQPGASLNLGKHFRIHTDLTYERMTVGSAHLFTANIAQASAAYQFNTRAFLRAIVQHYSIDYNIDQYEGGLPSEEKELLTQLLFSYKLNPRTVLFFGYSDTSAGQQLARYQVVNPNSTHQQSYGLTLVERTIFAKIGYAWSF
jgi:hypothetical protein